MRKSPLILAGLASLSLSATAVADKPEHAEKPDVKPVKTAPAGHDRPDDGDRGDRGEKKGHRTHWHAFHVHGTLVSQALTVNPDGTVDGTVVVKTSKKVRTAKRGPKTVVTKETTFTLDDAKLSVKTDDRTGDQKVDLADVRAGDRVKLEGRVEHRHGRKDASTDAPKVELRRVKFDDPKPAKPAPAPAPTPAPTPTPGS